MTPKMTRAWVAELGAGLVSLCMRFEQGGTVPSLDVHVFPRSREDRTPEQHVRVGLLDEQDLLLLRDAINKYLGEHCLLGE